MSIACTVRLMADLDRLKNEEGISGAPRENNIMFWDAIIIGPAETPWEGGILKLILKFSQGYPNTPPKVQFVSKIFHPNELVLEITGSICLDILSNKWSSAYDVAAVLTSIQSLLCDPNPDSPANREAADLYRKNPKEYKRRVRKVVEQSL